MYIIIDNFDSFTYNIYQILTELTSHPIKVFRNNSITIEEIKFLNPLGIIISPGPGRPEGAGVSMDIIRKLGGEIPILGVCLGHQVIGEVFGCEIVRAQKIAHGKVETVSHDGKGLFRNIADTIECTRYHSLAISKMNIPEELEVTSNANDGEIMGIRHKEYVIEGVQFHPESIASESGRKLLRNFLNYKRIAFPVKEKLEYIMDGQDLTRDESAHFMEELTEGNISDLYIAAYLAALNTKGICVDEIVGCASILQKKRIPINTLEPVLDTCGTGGDSLGTFNISSFAALVAVAGGAVVAKHGNKAVSSKSGSSDFFRELGIPVDITPDQAELLIEKFRFSFLFAPVYHKAMAHVASVRKVLGVKTIMNVLGPLVNPASAEFQIIGVYSEDLCELMANAAHQLGVKRVLVVHGLDGIDELSISALSRVIFIDENGCKDDFIFDPTSIGIRGFSLEDLKGGSAQQNKDIALDLLNGNGNEAIKQSVLLNGGAGLYVYGKAKSIAHGYELAKSALEEGKVKELLVKLQGTLL